MAFGDIIQSASAQAGGTLTLPNPVVAGNSVVVIGSLSKTIPSPYPPDLSDGLNSGNYEVVRSIVDPDETFHNAVYYMLPGTIAGTTAFTLSAGSFNNSAAFEVEGVLASSVGGEGSDGIGADATSIVTTSAAIPANSVSFAFSAIGAPSTRVAADSPWVNVIGATNNRVELWRRADSTSVTDNYSGAINSSENYVAVWNSFVEGSSAQTVRKGSAFDVETALGTITTATLNGVDVFDHVTGQTGTTVSFAGLATDEITTSGEYTLVLGDGATTETITVQVNVVGLASFNINKDGADQGSLTDVEFIILTGAAGSRAINDQIINVTTTVGGDTGAIEITDTALNAGDTIMVAQRSDTVSGGGGAFHPATLELI